LVVFPAGEVASFQFSTLRVSDPEWTANVARLSKLATAPVLPVFFHGTNSPVFHMTGLIHPRLRTALLPHELLNKAGSEVRLSIGAVIPVERLAAAADPTAYLRGRTLMLEARAEKLVAHGGFPWVKPATIAGPQEAASIAAELANLPPDRTLLNHGEYRVCVAEAHQIPITLLEIGRLREITFRHVGEGTGRSVDLDSFDQYYSHLLVWNEETRTLVGAYRLAKTDHTIASRGVTGLYTNTLFHLTPAFYRSIHPALELGRSFVRIEEQKSFLPLLLLWKGIAHYVARNPRYRTLFGPVSISKEYSSPSRALMVSYFKANCGNGQLAAQVKPRNPFRNECDPRSFSSLLSNVDELSEVIADIEPDHKRLPVLLRHYLNLGGQILDFNVDRRFSNVVDGLVVLDLAKVSRRHLERYMGPESAAEFLKKHNGSRTGAAA
jgi:putative hemolysin